MALNYKSYLDLSEDIKKALGKLPLDIELIVGIPRSGMIPAYMIGAFLNLPVTTLDEYLNNITPTRGDRKLKKDFSMPKKVLVVDDSVNLGNSFKRTKEKLKCKQAKHVFFAVYATKEGQKFADVYGSICEQPRIFQWNYLYHDILSKACVDIDGVLCIDPTEEQNDDGGKYINFLLTAAPLFIPNYRIRALVTSRLEKYREQTEEWLRKNKVQYEELYMLDLPTKEERIKQSAHEKFKSEIYKKLSDTELFLESEREQAAKIAVKSGKAVLCVATDEIFPSVNNRNSQEELELLALNHELALKNDEIRKMSGSKFWKIRNFCVKIKNGIYEKK